MDVRPLTRGDYAQWLPLWQENCLNNIAADITAETWRRVCHPKEPVYGLGAFKGDDLAGILHYVLHPTTGYVEPACYMQDLYVPPLERRSGVARRLVWELETIGKAQNWSRIYWFAQHSNEAAQKLYKTLGIPMDFSLHMLSTKKA